MSRTMTTIIQISDFHIKMTMGNPRGNTTFTDMVESFKQFQHNGGKILIVYNGDIIDNTNIYEKIKKNLKRRTADQKAAYWEKRAKEEYNLAVEYINYMLAELGISVQELVFCCGNHDVNTWYDSFEKAIDCPYGKKAEYSQKRFEQYEAFLDKLNMPESRRAQTFFVSKDGFNFLVANSNWLNKFQYPTSLCINCKEIDETIKSRKELLKDNLNINKYKNIFVSHAPIADYCEEARFGFEKNNYAPITDQIDEYFGLQLFGDKHTGHAKGAEHIVGAPLDSDRITCVAHQFTEDKTYFYRTLTYVKGKKWEITQTEQYIEDILKISEHYIKDKAKEYLFFPNYPNALSALKHFELIRASQKWHALNMLFKASSKIREPSNKGSGTALPVGTNYINTLTRLVATSDKRISITVRGGSRLGKSVCLSVLYMNMLHRFSCGTFDYIPVYINIEKILQDISTETPGEDRDTRDYYNKVMSVVTGILQVVRNKCKIYEYDACCIIDGLNQYCYYRNAKIDNGIMRLFSQRENACFKHLVMCIDTDNNASPKVLEYTEPHQNVEAQYVIYFDPIKTYKIHAQERYESFVEAYCGLHGLFGKTAEKSIKIIKDNVDKMGILDLDTNMMTYCWDKLIIKDCREDYYSLLGRYVSSKIPDVTEEIERANYMLYVEGRGYSEIKRRCGIDNNTFDIIRMQPSIAKYLLAQHYVKSIAEYDLDISTEKATIPTKSCLNQLLDHEICTLVRRYIVVNNLSNTILEFAEKYYDSLLPSGRATLTYLVGRLSLRHDEIERVLSIHQDSINELEQKKKDQGSVIDNYERVASRSVTVSRIFNNINNYNMRKAVLDYVHKLISNENDRKINRRFHLQFYGDRKNEESSMNSDMIFDGFDIYCTYHILCQRLQKISEERSNQRLLCLELFTLCDLIQIRIDNPKAITSKGVEVDSFFYNEKYNAPNDSMALGVIIHMKNIVSTYLDLYGNNDDDLFIEYLNHQIDTYERILPILEQGPLRKDVDSYKPQIFLEELIRLEETKRMGWLFPDLHKSISHNTFIKKRDGDLCYETTLQHVYEMYLIGLIYLPKESDHADYDKRIILELVLLHDLGEAYTGDSIKAYEKNDELKKEEKYWCRNLYLQGVHEGIADLTDYGKLWDQWNDQVKPTYNVMVAKDLDYLQLLYKLLLLLTQKDVKFSKNRFIDFWELRQNIQTNEVIRIFNILIAGNQTFKNAIKNKYEIMVNELQERI